VLLLISFVFSALYPVHARGADITVLLDGEKLFFQDVQPQIIDGRTLVPLRAVFEALEALVTWDEKTQGVAAVKGNIDINLTIGSSRAYKNGQLITIDVPPQIINGRTLVPLRFIGEAFNYQVDYLADTKTILITGKGLAGQSLPSQGRNNALFNLIAVGDKKKYVLARLGNPNRIDKTGQDFDWWIFHSDYDNYLQVGIKDEDVVALYSNAKNLSLGNLAIGSTKADIRKIFAIKDKVSFSISDATFTFENNDPNRVLAIDGELAYIFYLDAHQDHSLAAVRMMERDYLIKKRLYGYAFSYYHFPEIVRFKPLNNQNSAYERQMVDLVNSTRNKFELTRLTWNEAVANVARIHSEDMLVHDFFGHESPRTGTPFDRLRAARIRYVMAAENLAYNQSDAIEAHHGLMNSLGHRVNILTPGFKEVGVGVKGDEVNKYYTQKFIAR
jgi:uncharacterized protein YkwD